MAPDPRKIIHVDMDAFYASVEQRDNPELRGKPLAVGGAAARGVVAAASYEARAFGVRSAMPSVTAKRRCPELIFVPPRFDVYRAVSAQIREVFSEHTDLIEPLSLDEAYLDVTQNRLNIASATTIAEMIRSKILLVTGLTASAGISYNKFLAKMASDQNKPNGQFVITPRHGPAFVETLPVKKFHGVGPATAAKMEALGIETGADLRDRSLPFLQQHFGKSGLWYYQIARAIDRYLARAHPGCHLARRVNICPADIGGEPIFGVVADRDCLVERLVGHDRQDGPEDFLPRDGHVRRHVGEHRGLDIIALVQAFGARDPAGDQRGAFIDA